MAFRDDNPTFSIVRFEPSQQPDTRSFNDGTMWYDVTAKQFKGIIAGAVSNIGAGAGSGLPTLPTSPNNVPQIITSTPSGGIGGAATWSLSGITNRNVAGVSDTILASDCSNAVVYSNGSAVGVTLNTATSMGVPACAFRVYANGAGAVTITPTTWQISVNGAAAGSTLVLNQNQNALITVDGAGAQWDAVVYNNSLAGSAGAVLLVPTVTQTIAPSTNSLVSLTVKGTSGTGTPHIQDWNTAAGGAGSAGFIDANGNIQAQGGLFSASDVVAGPGNSFRGTGNTNFQTNTETASPNFGVAPTGNTHTGTNIFGMGDYQGTGGGTGSASLFRGGDATGASGANFGGTWTGRGGNVATTGAGTPGAVSLSGGGFTGAATNGAGANVTLAGGLGTGNGVPSNVFIKTPALLASGTTAQSLVTRKFYHVKAGSLTSATATNFFNIPVAASQTAGYKVFVHVETTQATPQNCSTAQEFYAVVQNTGGTITANTSSATAATICSTGTLTIAVGASLATPSVFSVTPSWTTIVPTAVNITIEVTNLSQQDVTLL